MEVVTAVQRAIDWMEEHLYDRLELEDIAAAAYMSVPSMYRAFYALTGHPLKEYVRKRRTSQAAVLLRQTDMPVVDIAFACGFDSYQTFTKSFKKLTGLTPGTYRQSALYYSFERVNLLENVSYVEDKALTEQYPDVKVIRLGPMDMIAYRHVSATAEGLEEEAFRVFCRALEESGFPLAQSRLFGRNIDEDGTGDETFVYEMLATCPPQTSEPNDQDAQQARDGRSAQALEQRRFRLDEDAEDAEDEESDDDAGLQGQPENENAAEVRDSLSASPNQPPLSPVAGVPLTLTRTVLPEGLYAVSSTSAGSASSIVAAWNRLLSEWLPRSTFTLGEHGYIEEFIHFQGNVTRLKLYLPVARRKEQDPIEIRELQPVRLFGFRCHGPDSAAQADASLVSWLRQNKLAYDSRAQLYMAYSYGLRPGDDYWYELAISLPDDKVALISPDNSRDGKRWRIADGGLYACLTTSAYGAMTGVLDQLYGWLFRSDEFEPDNERQWFAKYTPGDCSETDMERSTLVTCHVPVRRKK